MFKLFQKHRLLKLGGLTIGLFLLWYLISPFVDLVKGMDVELIDLIGNYAYGSDHYVELITDQVGKMTSKEAVIEFTYTYDKGLVACISLDEETTWSMRAVSNNALFNEYDSTYLFKIEQ